MAVPGQDHPSVVTVARSVEDLGKGRRVVAVDGFDGAGKTTFADLVAGAVERPTVRATCDDFLNPEEIRYVRGRDSPEGFYLDSFDYDALEGLLLDPFRSGSTFTLRLRDPRTDTESEPEVCRAPRDAVLILDGLFMHRERLRGRWDLSVFLDVDLDTAGRRLREREGHSRRNRYTEGQELYLADAAPASHASLVVPW